MNVSKENSDALNAVITINIGEEDYKERIETVLRDHRRNANMKGFRPGKVPMGMIRKMYYTPVLVDEINKLISEKLFSYIRDEDLQILGEPLPYEGEKKTPDFENDKEFEFKFDIGLAPEINGEITQKDKITYYKIKVEDKAIDEQLDNVAKRFGEFNPVEKAGNDELLQVNLKETDESGLVREEGVATEDASMSLDMMKDDKEKALFKGKKPGDKVVFDIKKAYPNDTELSALLKIDKEKLAETSSSFEVEILEVKEFKKHDINQELFDKVYGEGVVTSEDEFRAKIAEELKMNYERESNYKFALDTKDYLIKRAKADLPVDFLKRWILSNNKELTTEKLDEEFAEYENEFRWQLIKERVASKYEIEVSEEELLEYTMILTRNQFYQYGLYNVTEEQLENYAREQLKKPEEARRFRDQKSEDKIVKFVKETAKLDEKEISEEKFRKLFEN